MLAPWPLAAVSRGKHLRKDSLMQIFRAAGQNKKPGPPKLRLWEGNGLPRLLRLKPVTQIMNIELEQPPDRKPGLSVVILAVMAAF